MKNKFIKVLASILSTTMITNTSLPTFAYDLDENRNSIESVEYQESTNEDFTNATNVFAKLKSEYKITIPKTIVLSGAKKAANYFVKVVGDIAGYEAIKVVPDKNFDLHTKNKDPYTAKVEQDRTIWYVNDLGTDGNGLVSADNLSAGAWQGVFYFNIDFVNQLEEKVFGDIILDEDLDADYRLILSKLNLAGIYDNKGNLLATEKELFEKGYNPQANDGSAASIINKYYPQAEYVSLSDEITSIGDNAFKGTNIKYVHIPSTVTSIGSKAFADSKIVSANIPSGVTNISHDAFSNTPANNKSQNTNTYYGSNISRTITIDFENSDEAIIELERGYRYQITALYNFKDNVTKQSTIKSSNEAVVKFAPEYYLDAIDDGETVISGKYTTKSGKQKDASIKVRVKHTHVEGEKVIESQIDSTCVQNGSYDEVVYCQLCNREISRSKKTIGLKNHIYDSGTITTKASCITNGVKTFVCINCGKTRTESINKLGHNYVNDICTRCGQEKSYEGGLYDANWNLIYDWNELENLGYITQNSNTLVKTNLTTRLGVGNRSYNLVIPNTITTIGYQAMLRDHSFNSVTFPSSVTKLESQAIYGLDVKKVVLSDNIKYIGDYAMWACESLTEIKYKGKVYQKEEFKALNTILKESGVQLGRSTL